MVRNVASMQSLRNQLVDCDMASPADSRAVSSPTQQQSTTPLQHLGGPSVQLRAKDDYARALMNKVATGNATHAERSAFDAFVGQASRQPSIAHLINNDQPASLASGSSGSPMHPAANKPVRCTHESHQMQAQTAPSPHHVSVHDSRRHTLPPPASATVNAPLSSSTANQQDYQMQLMLLEQQNKKRLLMARREQEEKLLRQHNPPSSHPEEQDKKRFFTATQAQRGTKNDVPQQRPASDLSVRTREMQRSLMEQGAHLAEQHKNVVQAAKFMDVANQLGRERELLAQRQRRERAQLEVMWKASLTQQKMEHTRALEPQLNEAVLDESSRFRRATRENAAKYTKPFCDFLTENPTVFHCVDAMKKELHQAGFTELSERDVWDIEPAGSYYVERNGSSLIAFTVGAKYESGNGAAILAGHVDALTAKLKPISQVPNKAGYLQLGVAPYAGALNSTWWDRDLGIGGRVHVKEGDKIVTKLVKLDWPIARIPTLAPHFGEAASGPFNKETQMVPIIGLGGTDSRLNQYDSVEPHSQPPLLGGMHGPVGSFTSTQPPALVSAIQNALGMTKGGNTTIVNWELELYDVQPATVGGLNKEFIFAGRIDDKLCSWAALQALLESDEHDTEHSSLIKVVGLFDDEEIGSLLRQGAKGNFLPMTMERVVGALVEEYPTAELLGRTYANSFMISSDVTHAVNPNFLNAYLENHAPHLNVGIAVAADSNGHMTTDSVSTAILKRCADKVGAQLQVFQIRNDSRSGGTVGPMLSSALGVRTIDAGLAQLSMHSIRATTGALDPGLGVLMFTGFLNGFESVDKEFQE